MQTFSRSVATALTLSLFVGGLTFCSDDDPSADPSSQSDGGASADGRGPDGVPTGDGSTANLDGASAADAAPTKLPGDPAACPTGFTTTFGAGHHGNFMSGGQKRSFDLALPPAKFTGPRPLLFTFHGTGRSGALAISDYDLADWVAAGFIVVAPDSNGNGSVWPVWDALTLPGGPPQANADLTLFDELLKCVAGHHDVDAKRIYAAGQSAGGAMTNFMLGHRSAVLAGGVAASGAFDATQTNANVPIDPVTAIVTWGGSNDIYSGSTGGSAIANMGYAEQSALASAYWKKQPGSYQIACKGNELGHTWLNAINGWLIDTLLAHPKGHALVPGQALPPLPNGSPATCSDEAAPIPLTVTINCPTSTTLGCQQYCQLLGDCMVENGTLGPIAVDQIQDVGYTKSANACGGCVTRCESDASGSSVDTTVLGCLAAAGPTTTCGPGFGGAAAFNTIGACCGNKPTSKVCSRYCTTFKKSDLFSMVLTGCP